MSNTYVGQILVFAGTFAPYGYMLCNGQLLPIAQYETLYALIGTTYGGNGVTNFALPDLRSRIPLHQGQGPGLQPYFIGMLDGVENVSLIGTQIPMHNHMVAVSTGRGSTSVATPSGTTYLGDGYQNPSQTVYNYLAYANGNPAVPLAPNSISSAGSSFPHNNIQPCQAILYCIATVGVFPTQG